MDENQKKYSSRKVVRHFVNYTGLQKPEGKIFNILEKDLPSMKMLDIGVGGGRTTGYFLPKVKTYVGMDYSEGMIAHCKNKFPNHPHAEFVLGDARTALNGFETGAFDLVLFSFNGIDNMNRNERLSVQKEIRRICRPDGFFCYSSHNIQCLPDFLKIKFRINFIAWMKAIFNRRGFINANREQMAASPTADYVTIFDTLYDFGLATCYTRPSAEIKLLRETGFRTVRVFPLSDGSEIGSEKELSQNKDSWLYYLCN